jgi:hypothetical protein
MADIRDPNYETVTATCDLCGANCVFSRIDDLREVMPIAGRRVVCPACHQEFWIKGDRINTAYQFLLDDAKEHFDAKRYMPAIASLGQAWEVFFATCALSTYVYRPFFKSQSHYRSADKLNALSRKLRAAITRFTWFPLRNLVINIAVRGIQPLDIQSAEEEIARITAEGFGNDVSAETISGARNQRRREAAEALFTLTVGNLRNHVVHMRAYRPRRHEVEPCLESELSVLYRVKHRLGVGDFLEHQANAVYQEE